MSSNHEEEHNGIGPFGRASKLERADQDMTMEIL